MDVIAVIIEHDENIVVALAGWDVKTAGLISVCFTCDRLAGHVHMVSAFVCVLRFV